MKTFSVFLFLLLLNSEIDTARSYYLSAYESKEYAEKLKDYTKLKSTAIMQAYYGTALTFLAKHSYNPYKKLDYLNKGLKDLNEAVLRDTNDVEIRFLRFSIEENIPGFIPFTSHLKLDKSFLQQNLKSNHGFYKTIQKYILQSKSFSENEKKSFN